MAAIRYVPVISGAVQANCGRSTRVRVWAFCPLGDVTSYTTSGSASTGCSSRSQRSSDAIKIAFTKEIPQYRSTELVAPQ